MSTDHSGNPYRIHRKPQAAPVAPKHRSGGCGWFFLCLILAGMLGLTWIGILASAGGEFAVSGGSADDYWEEHALEDNGSEDRIAVIKVDGLISNLALDPSGMTMVRAIKSQLSLAAQDASIKGVLLQIDSPGGEVLASDDIYREIKRFQEDSNKPVVASMSGLAASGGYYVAAPCRWIVANELTITGSIGVILHSYNYRGLMDKVGVIPKVFKSGKFKDMLGGDQAPEEILPEAEAMVQAMVDETFDRFKTVVLEGRTYAREQNGGAGQSLAPDWVDHADGRILSGKQAFELGFVDELGGFDQAVDRIAQMVGSPNPNLIELRQPFNFGSFFRLFGSVQTQSIKLDLGMDLPRLQAGRLYFLASNYIQ